MPGSWSWALFILQSWLSHPNNKPSTSVATAPPSVPRLYVYKILNTYIIYGSDVKNTSQRVHYVPHISSSSSPGLDYDLKEKFLLLSVFLIQALPPGGISIFASQLHTHLAGRGVRTVLVRGGKELEVVQEDQHFSTHYQVRASVYPQELSSVYLGYCRLLYYMR